MHVAGGGGSLTAGGQAFLGQVGAATGGNGGAPDIKFDKDGVQTLIKELKAIVEEDLTKARRSAEAYSHLSPSGHPVGDRYVQAVREFGNNYMTWNNQYIDAVKETIDLLETTIKEYEGRDDEEARRFNEGLST